MQIGDLEMILCFMVSACSFKANESVLAVQVCATEREQLRNRPVLGQDIGKLLALALLNTSRVIQPLVHFYDVEDQFVGSSHVVQPLCFR